MFQQNVLYIPANVSAKLVSLDATLLAQKGSAWDYTHLLKI